MIHRDVGRRSKIKAVCTVRNSTGTGYCSAPLPGWPSNVTRLSEVSVRWSLIHLGGLAPDEERSAGVG